MRSRQGFTLVELLVVIAIIGVLVAILLPAVQAAREASRRSQCQNHLKQLGVALQNHHDTRQSFPTNQTAGGPQRGEGCEGGYYSWRTQLLPFVEQQTLYDAIDFSVPMADGCSSGASISTSHPNAQVAATTVPVFLCPTDVPGENAALMGSANPAGDSYAANAGWPSRATGFAGERATPGKANGMVVLANPRRVVKWHSAGKLRMKDVTDGTSHTVAIAERLIQTASSLAELRDAPPALQSFHVTGAARPLGEMAQRCSPAQTHSEANQGAYLGRAWISGWSATGGTYMHLMTPNQNHCHFTLQDDEGDFAVTAGSRHAGGAQVVMADGHVEFVVDAIAPEVWWALGSRNGGETNVDR